MRKIKLWLQNAATWVLTILLLGSIVLVPVTIVAKCVEFWVSLFR